MRNVGSVLRMSETEAAAMALEDVDPTEDQTMIINMGPQHPSTHGVLRLMLELQGETVLRCKPIIGYLHTGMEKQGEELSFRQEDISISGHAIEARVCAEDPDNDFLPSPGKVAIWQPSR